MPFAYPVALELRGRQCAVIGGGRVAEQKARSLLEAGAAVVVIAEHLTPGLLELAQRGELRLARKAYSTGDLDGVFLAIAATDRPEVNRAVFQEAEERRVLLNAVDDTDHCHFAVPAVVKQGELTLAISTGGAAPALAKRLRTQLSEQFGPEWEVLCEVLGQARREALPARQAGFEIWARRWQAALDRPVLALVKEGRLEEAGRLVVECLTTDEAETEPAEPPCSAGDGPPLGGESPGVVAIVGAGPGDAGLISVRGQALLDEADVVVYDRLVNPALVEGKTSIFVGKEPGAHCLPQREINELLVMLARQGRRVVRLKGGDPFVFGRGGEEAEALAEARIEFEVVSGPTSAVAAPAAAGIPVTDRRYASSVAFVTGHGARGGDAEPVDWRRLATAVDTIVMLMGIGSIEHAAIELIRGGRSAATPAAAIQDATLPSQRVLTGTLGTIAEQVRIEGIRSPAVVVIGEVVAVHERVRRWHRNSAEAARFSWSRQASPNTGKPRAGAQKSALAPARP